MLNTRCPECRAWLKAQDNFTPGERVTCPKCEAPIAVREPGPGERRTDAEREFVVGSSGGSILWLATFVLLIAGIAALGFVISQKLPENRDANKGDKGNIKAPAPQPVDVNEPPDGKQPKGGNPPGKGGKGKGKGRQPNANQPIAKQPAGKLPPPKPAGGGLTLGPLGGILGGGATVTADEKAKLLEKYKTALVGTWTADLGGVMEELTYGADGAYTQKRTGPGPETASGKYSVKDLVGTKTLKIQLDTADGARPVTAVLDGDELQHPTLQKGVTGVFRKK